MIISTLRGLSRTILVLTIFFSIVGSNAVAQSGSKPVAIFFMMPVDSNIQFRPDLIPDWMISPLLLVQGQQILAVPSIKPCKDEVDAGAKFSAEYLNRSQYYVYSGGRLRAELATSDRSISNAPRQFVRFSGGKDAPGNLLAATWDRLGRTDATKRKPTEVEAKEFLKLAGIVLQNDYQFTAKQVEKLRALSMAVGTISKDTTVMIGTARIQREDHTHDLFMIASVIGTSMSPLVVNKAEYSDPKKELQGYFLVDKLDLNGDGVDEIIASRFGFTGVRVYGLRDGKWDTLYDDQRWGPGGCCVKQLR
jgi:hypothetical protein